MGYSRWGERGSGHWYTFWTIYPLNGEETRDNAMFEIYDVAIFTAKELRENMEKCLADVILLKGNTTTKKEFAELKGYMIQFLHDVNKEYNLPYIPFF